MKTKQFKITSQVLILTSSLLLTFCAPPREAEKITYISKVVINAEDTIPHPTKREGNAHSGKYYWKIDSANVYGLNYIFQINDSLQQKDVRIILNAWVRFVDLDRDQKYAFSLEDGFGKMLNWSEINFRSHVAETNKWVNVIDSVTIPGNLINMSGAIIKTFSFNPDGKSSLDCDDVELSFFKVEKVLEK